MDKLDELEKEVAELKQILKQKDEKREQEIIKREQEIIKREQEIIKLNKSVRELEQEIIKLNEGVNEFFSCQMCGFVDNLNVCYSCCKKVCRYCHTIKEKKDCHEDVIYRCLCSNCV